MCLIIFDWQPDKKRILTLASNRDEFHDRPSEEAHFWPDHPHIFGGRDLKAKGTWLAVSDHSRLAAVTNYRSPETEDFSRSRGEIPSQFLASNLSAIKFADLLTQRKYSGFNAVLFDGSQLVYCTNRASGDTSSKDRYHYDTLNAGRYGLSNHLLNTPWPKVKRSLPSLNEAARLDYPQEATDILLSALQDQKIAGDGELPKTGVSKAFERMLSSVFISDSVYGTRTSTVVIIEKKDDLSTDIRFHERQYKGDPKQFEDKVQIVNCRLGLNND